MKFPDFFESDKIDAIFEIFAIVIIGYLVIQLLVISTRKIFIGQSNKQYQMIFGKVVQYTGFVVIALMVFDKLGWDITKLLGAAGLLGIVVGIASQTSIGNIISGLFLISEKPFQIGDTIRVWDKSGVVFSIDLLSIKLKTFDNLLIRIPNQTIISTDLINVTKFPIRRMDIRLSVRYSDDLEKVQNLLKELAMKNPLCLNEPDSLFLIDKFGNDGIEILYALWFEKSNFLKLKNSIMKEIILAFKEADIEIPFPHRVVIVENSSNAIIP